MKATMRTSARRQEAMQPQQRRRWCSCRWCFSLLMAAPARSLCLALLLLPCSVRRCG
uniref:Uncharacterized protein n=1 Tax=Arundo donax TaxID=35708 RepID=A0A0A9FH10_ARUDO